MRRMMLLDLKVEHPHLQIPVALLVDDPAPCGTSEALGTAVCRRGPSAVPKRGAPRVLKPPWVRPGPA